MHIKYGYDGAMAGHFFDPLNDDWKVEDEDLTPHAEVTTNGDETEIFDADQDLRMTVKRVVWDDLNPGFHGTNFKSLMEEVGKIGHIRIHPTATPTGMLYFIGLYAPHQNHHLGLKDEELFSIEAPSIEEGLKAVASFLENDYEG
mgnify:CR=1 FL=1